ncbi:MAG: 5-(carboxyamino)imidazole ribonucleotide synthase [Epsilonproteobacteria bacterium]|nr:MAG: 5-(carboxyamino)imidazole ribonucleotide synthase [Campylobacterota bacterium]
MIDKLANSSLKLGIISGGQLGKMLIQEASKWAIATYILDPDPDCPAKRIATEHVQGDFLDFDTVYAFGKEVDILTYEMENINIEALLQLKADGFKVVPDPQVLALIQDKGLQKEFYQKHAIPTSPFACYENSDAITKAIEEKDFTYPFVQKLRKGGYDGHGVALIHSAEDSLLNGSSMLEKKVEIDKEIAVIVARNDLGEVRCFPTVEMTFDAKTNLVEDLFCPANISDEDVKIAEGLAIKIIENLEMVGLLAVEFFIDINGEILVNEVAPRPHNSGHHTIESVMTSQLEQMIRAILGLPLGSTDLIMPSVMLNLLGEAGHTGEVRYEGLSEVLSIEGVKVHLYGKQQTRPSRKMGHVTVLADTVENALQKANKVKNIIKVKSWEK